MLLGVFHRENGGITLQMEGRAPSCCLATPRSQLKGDLTNNYPLYKVYMGLIIKELPSQGFSHHFRHKISTRIKEHDISFRVGAAEPSESKDTYLLVGDPDNLLHFPLLLGRESIPIHTLFKAGTSSNLVHFPLLC